LEAAKHRYGFTNTSLDTAPSRNRNETGRDCQAIAFPQTAGLEEVSTFFSDLGWLTRAKAPRSSRTWKRQFPRRCTLAISGDWLTGCIPANSSPRRSRGGATRGGRSSGGGNSRRSSESERTQTGREHVASG
jgi:hypothetical protein